MQIPRFSWNCKFSQTFDNCIHRSQIMLMSNHPNFFLHLFSSLCFWKNPHILCDPWNVKEAYHCGAIISCWAWDANILVGSSKPSWMGDGQKKQIFYSSQSSLSSLIFNSIKQTTLTSSALSQIPPVCHSLWLFSEKKAFQCICMSNFLQVT